MQRNSRIRDGRQDGKYLPWISEDIQYPPFLNVVCDNIFRLQQKENEMYDLVDDDLEIEGWLNGHEVYRDEEYGGICYDGYHAVDASDYEEAEMEYWNTH